MKTKDTIALLSIVVIAMLITGFSVNYMKGKASVADEELIDPDTGESVAPWVNKLVDYQLVTTNLYTGGNVASTALVYEVQPADWGNPRGTFDDASQYSSYTASSGVVTVNRETPGDYFAVITASGYNTEFVTFSIPDGVGRGDIADYQSNPDREAIDMTSVGSTTDEDFALTLVNDSSAEVRETVILTVADNTNFKGWKVIVNDQGGFSLDTDGDGTYDEGISSMKVSVAGIEKTVFDPDRGIDEFDSNDEFTFMLDGIEIADSADLILKVDIEAITGDYTGANDEVWGESEGVLSYIKIYDLQGNLFATSDVTA